MSLYTIADTHLSFTTHKPMDVFGPRWVNFEKSLKDNWTSLVKDEDTVVLPGDISWGIDLEEAKEDLRFLHSLPGRKIIGQGNHDYWWNTFKKMNTFTDENGFDTIEFLHNNAYVCEDHVICGSRGWYIDQKTAPADSDYQKIVLREANRLELSLKEGVKLLKDGMQILVFMHFPPVFGGYICNEIVDIIKKYGVKRCYYGHIHSKYDSSGTTEYAGIEFNIISADYLRFVPYRINV